MNTGLQADAVYIQRNHLWFEARLGGHALCTRVFMTPWLQFPHATLPPRLPYSSWDTSMNYFILII